MRSVMSAILASFGANLDERGCPPGLTMEQIVLQGYATMAEVELVRGAYEAHCAALDASDGAA
jgi:hypothetical protein